MSWNSARYIGKNTADNQVDTTNITSDADGSILERLEFIQAAVGSAAGQLRTTQSASVAVEENAYVQFNIGVFDMDAGAIASASIDITGISAVMEKSTGGAAFASAGITQPTFAKANGSVYCAYQFLAAEWQEGDMYKLVVGGITATIGTATAYIADMVWSNVITELEDLETAVEAIPSSTGSNTWNATALASVEAECTDAIEADELNHLIAESDGGTNKYPDSVAQDSILAYIMAKGDPALATSFDNSTDSLEAISDSLASVLDDTGTSGVVVNSRTAAADRIAGETQMIEVSVTSAANAGDVTLATVTTQPCLIEAIVVHADTASQTDLTTAAVSGGASKVVTFLSTAATAVAYLDSVDDQVAWTGAVRLAATKTIVMSLVGTGATAVDLTVTIKYRSCVDGGYLA